MYSLDKLFFTVAVAILLIGGRGLTKAARTSTSLLPSHTAKRTDDTRSLRALSSGREETKANEGRLGTSFEALWKGIASRVETFIHKKPKSAPLTPEQEEAQNMLLPLGGLPESHDFDSWLVKETKSDLDRHGGLFDVWLRKSLTPEYVEAAFKEAGKADHDSAKFLVDVYKKTFEFYKEKGWVLMSDKAAAQGELLVLSGMRSHDNFDRWLEHIVNEEDISLRRGLFGKWLNEGKHPGWIAGMFKEAGKDHDTGVQDLIENFRITFVYHEQAGTIVTPEQLEVRGVLLELSGETGRHDFDAWLKSVVNKDFDLQDQLFEKWLIDGKNSEWFKRKFEEAGKADNPDADNFLLLFKSYEEKRRYQFYHGHFPIGSQLRQRTETVARREVPRSGAKVKKVEGSSSLRAPWKAAQRVT